MKTTEIEIKERKLLEGDPIIWGVVFILALISILLVYSATGTLAFKYGKENESYLLKHSLLFVLSFVVMWVCHKVDYKYFSRISRLALLFSVPLLIFTWGYGTTINDATRWLTIPYINHTFQPADLAKLALIANVASMLSKRQQDIRNIERTLIPILFWCGLICGLIALSDFSGAAILFATCLLIMFIGRMPLRYLAGVIMVGVMVGAIALAIGQRGGTAKNRMSSYLDANHLPFQTEQSYIAVATGGFVGKGPGQSHQRNFLPHPYSDFIFAILVEEYGFMGAMVVIGLFLTLLYRGMLAVNQSENAFGGLLSAGLSFSVAFQAMINMGVATGILPVTGLQLPLVSMGGTSLLLTGASIGIIISVSRSNTYKPILQSAKEKLFKRNTGRVARV